MERRKEEAEIEEYGDLIHEEIEQRLNQTKIEWEELKQNEMRYWEEDILDFHNIELNNDNKKEKIKKESY